MYAPELASSRAGGLVGAGRVCPSAGKARLMCLCVSVWPCWALACTVGGGAAAGLFGAGDYPLPHAEPELREDRAGNWNDAVSCVSARSLGPLSQGLAVSRDSID